MPKYKNEKVVWLRFKVQDSIRNKGHLFFPNKIISIRGTLRNLLFQRIFSERRCGKDDNKVGLKVFLSTFL
jgi:hypothetical protein